VNLGLLEREAGHTDAAITAFERAAGAKGDAMEGPYLLAETLAVIGRRQEARRWATEAARRSPNDARVQQLLARVQK
jgi:predicted Zn-dependent protease